MAAALNKDAAQVKVSADAARMKNLAAIFQAQ
jgi:hypothetical protein